MEVLISKAIQEGFQVIQVGEAGSGGDITAVQEGVDKDFFDPLNFGLLNQGLEVVDVGVDIAVGEEADEVDSPSLV